MTNKEVIEIIRSECSAVAPDRFASLNYEEAEKYKDTVPKASVKRNYIAAAAIYAAACAVVLLIIPFIIGGGDIEPPVVPGNNPPVTDTAIVTESEKYEPDIVRSDDTVMNEFFATLDRAVRDGRITQEHNKNECVEVTSTEVFEKTGARIFTFVDTYYTYIYADGDVYGVLRNGQLHSVPGMLVCDHDGNGREDILLAVSWIDKTLNEKTSFYFFDMETKTDGPMYKVFSGQRTVRREISDYGTVRYAVTDVSYFADTDRRFVMLPVSEGTVYGHLDFDETSIALIEFDPAREKVIPALEKGVAEERIPAADYWTGSLNCYYDSDSSTDLFAFKIDPKDSGWREYVYMDGDVYNIASTGPSYYGIESVKICDMDKNGIDDLWIYCSFGSGMHYYAISYFDANTKTVIPFHIQNSYLGPRVYIKEKIADDGEVSFGLYTDIKEYYLGTVEYADGKFTTNLICEGDITDAIKYVYGKNQ